MTHKLAISVERFTERGETSFHAIMWRIEDGVKTIDNVAEAGDMGQALLGLLEPYDHTDLECAGVYVKGLVEYPDCLTLREAVEAAYGHLQD